MITLAEIHSVPKQALPDLINSLYIKRANLSQEIDTFLDKYCMDDYPEGDVVWSEYHKLSAQYSDLTHLISQAEYYYDTAL